MALYIQILLRNWKRHMTAPFKWSEKLCRVDNGWRLQYCLKEPLHIGQQKHAPADSGMNCGVPSLRVTAHLGLEGIDAT
uniref:Uncharacterized protein n=1 Tax=Amphimedon queenslandica TaxID=400682 RepID=A0A1X7U096_AMPQE